MASRLLCKNGGAACAGAPGESPSWHYIGVDDGVISGCRLPFEALLWCLLQLSVDLRVKIQVWLPEQGGDGVFDVIFCLKHGFGGSLVWLCYFNSIRRFGLQVPKKMRNVIVLCFIKTLLG